MDWPGWCRRDKGDEAALEALLEAAPRYAAAISDLGFSRGELDVVGRLPGSATTDFGAPDARGPWDEEPMDAAERARQADLLGRIWAAFDAVVAAAPSRPPHPCPGAARRLA